MLPAQTSPTILFSGHQYSHQNGTIRMCLNGHNHTRSIKNRMASLVTYRKEITALNVNVIIGNNTTKNAYVQP
jgi:hypothetical protein